MDQGPKLTLGIIGGGQLAQMLTQYCPFHDLKIKIFSETANCPASKTDAEIFVGSLHNTNDVKKFFEKIQILTFENEFIDIQMLSKVKDEFEKVLIFPSIPTIQIAQNKLSQKYVFQKIGAATSKFFGFDPQLDSATDWLQKCSKDFNQFVIKKAMGGYDGKGNFVVKSESDILRAKDFLEKALLQNTPVYAEEFVEFSQELAQVYVRSLNGDFISYPLVISEQENGVCRLIYGPATEFGVSKKMEQQTTEIGKKLADSLNFVGTFAVEYFLTRDEQILINEMAPRVHNSGHCTIDASPTNQFENHIKAILGTPLKAPTTYPFFAMRNILGIEGLSKEFTDGQIKFINTEDAKVYWYNKSQTSPWRKLGHMNTISMTKQDLQRKINLMKDIETQFWSSL